MSIWIALCSLIVALAAVYFTIRFHYLSIIHTLAMDRARECNGHLIPLTNFRPDANLTSLSGVVSALIVYPQLIQLHAKKCTLQLLFIKDHQIRELLLLQLHTNIRVYFKNLDDSKLESARLSAKYGKLSDEHADMLIQQLKDCHSYFKAVYH